jgi:hypothetical protein
METTSPEGNSSLTYEDLELIRKKATQENLNAEALAYVTRRVGDPKFAAAMLQGPQQKHLDFLNENYNNEEIRKAFDQSYGIGASEKLHDPNYGFVNTTLAVARDVLTAPDKFAEGLKRGIGSAAVGAIGSVAKLIPGEVAADVADLTDRMYKHLSESNTGETVVGKGLSGAGKLVGQYVLPAAPLVKGLEGIQVSKAAAIPLAEGVLGFFAQNPVEDNTATSALWNLMADRPDSPAGKAIYSLIATDPDAPDYANRMKLAVDAVAMFGVGSAVIHGLASSVQAGRGWMADRKAVQQTYNTEHGVPAYQFTREDIAASRSHKINPDTVTFPWETAKANLGYADLLSAREAELQAAAKLSGNVVEHAPTEVQQTNRVQAKLEADRNVAHFFPEGVKVSGWVPYSLTDEMVVTAEGIMPKAQAAGKKILDDYIMVTPEELRGKLDDKILNDALLLSTMGRQGDGGAFRLMELVGDNIDITKAIGAEGWGAGVLNRYVKEAVPFINEFLQKDDWKGLVEFAKHHTGTEEQSIGKLIGLKLAASSVKKQLDDMLVAYRQLAPDVISVDLENALNRLTAMSINLDATARQMASSKGGALNSLKMFYEGRFDDIVVNGERQGVEFVSKPETAAATKKKRKDSKKSDDQIDQARIDASVRNAENLDEKPWNSSRYFKDDILRSADISGVEQFRNDALAEMTAKGLDFRTAQTLADELAKEAKNINFKEFHKNYEMIFAGEKQAAVERTTAQKMVDMLLAQRYSALLFNWKTHETNILSTAAHIITRVGSELAFGDSRTRALAVSKIAGMLDSVGVAAQIAAKAFVDEKHILSPHGHVTESNHAWSTQHLLGRDAEGPLGAAFNASGNALRLPSRVMLSSDEFLRQLVARGEVHANAEMQGRMLGHEGPELDAFIKGELSKAFTPEGIGLNPLAVTKANEATFQNVLNPNSEYMFERGAAKLGQMANHWAVKATLVPFYNTIVNLMRGGFRMIDVATPMLYMSGSKWSYNQRLLDDLKGINGLSQQAIARGQVIIGGAMAMSAVTATINGNMTGASPQKIWDAKLQREIEVQPYSIKIGDKWHNYGQYEPLSVPLKLWSSATQAYKRWHEAEDRGQFENAEEKFTEAWHAGFWALMTMNASNPFNSGLQELMRIMRQEQPEDWVGEVGRMQLDASVPTFLKHANVALHDGSQFDPKGFMQVAVARLPFLSDTVPMGVKRNILGEVMKDEVGHRFTNFIGNPQNYDPVLGTLLDSVEATGVKYAPPSPTSFFAGVDLRKKTTKGHDGKDTTLYDKYLDTTSKIQMFGGLTMRDALTRYISGDRFIDETFGVTRQTGRRTEDLQKIISKYHSASRDYLEKTDKSFMELVGIENTRYMKHFK